MDIKHLQYFEKALIDWDKLYTPRGFLHSKPLNLSQIKIIEEAIYKVESKKLPAVLRELIFLSGEFCPFFSTGIQPSEKNTLDIDDLLEDQKENPYFEFLEDHNDILDCFKNRIIWSFNTVYESSDKFYFVYLDEDTSDPLVYSFDGDKLYDLYKKGITDFNALIEPTKKVLSSFIYQLYVWDMESYDNNRPIYDESVFSTFLHPNTKSNNSKNLQKFYAFIANRNLSGVNYFIEQGIDVTANNNQAILNVTTAADLEGIKLLVKHGANLYTQNEKVLLIATIIKEPMFLRDLVNKYEFSQINKNRALVIVCSQGIRSSTHYLINAGADINAFNSLALQVALRNHHFNLVTELIFSLGANKKTNFGFLLLFKEEIIRVTGRYTNLERLFKDVSLTLSKEHIINNHYADLRKFYGNESVVLSEFPLKINIELEKLKNTNE
jgi:hypothetical protein